MYNFKVGQIFYNSWGYEQTNVDFYQVVKVTDKSVEFRAIESVKNYSSDTSMSGKTKPFINRFKDEKPFKKQTRHFCEKYESFNMKYGSLRLYTKPLHFSNYA